MASTLTRILLHIIFSTKNRAGLIAPELEPVETVRPHFRRMRELFNRFFSGQPDAQLSMGMSRDFETPVGTIKRRLHVARNRLRQALVKNMDRRAQDDRAQQQHGRELTCV